MSIAPRLLLVLVVAAVLATACGSTDRPDLADTDPVPTPTPTAPSEDDDAGDVDGDDDSGDDGPNEPEPTATPEPADPTPTLTPPPTPDPGTGGDGPDTGAQPVLLAIFTTGGFVPVEIALGDFPELVVMADGAVYREGVQITIFPPPLVPAVERLQLDGAALAEVQRILSESPALQPGVDFGSPPVADAPTTTVTSFVDGERIDVSAYALGIDSQVDPAARAARESLEAAIREIRQIVDAATATGGSARPPALAALTFPSLAGEENEPVRAWPIEPVPQPQPNGGACVVVSGSDLDAIWDVASSASVQTPWDIAGTAQPVVLRPVFPHESVC